MCKISARLVNSFLHYSTSLYWPRQSCEYRCISYAVTALGIETIFAAGLDITDPEPLPPDHEFLKLPNAVIIPHLGSATKKTQRDMSIAAAQNIVNGLENKPLVYEL